MRLVRLAPTISEVLELHECIAGERVCVVCIRRRISSWHVCAHVNERECVQVHVFAWMELCKHACEHFRQSTIIYTRTTLLCGGLWSSRGRACGVRANGANCQRASD